MKKKLQLCKVIPCILSLLFLHFFQTNAQTVVAKSVVASTGHTVPFLQHKPPKHDLTSASRKYPMIIFLHGIGERNDNTSLLPGSPVWALTGFGPIREPLYNGLLACSWNGKNDTFIVLQPMLANVGSWRNSYVDAMINYGRDSLKADTNRIYLTGHSLGGAGVFSYLNGSAANAKKLAAAVPVAAGPITPITSTGATYVSNAKLPFWGFHASDDSVAPVSATTNAFATLNAANPVVKPLITIWPKNFIPGDEHNPTKHVYNRYNYQHLNDSIIDIYEWFMGQNNDSLPNVLPVARAGNDTTISVSSGLANLNGSASSDADGKIVRYVWKKLSGPAGGSILNYFSTASSTTVSGLTTVGVYKFQLNVVDHRAAIARDTITITVGGNEAPVVVPNSNVTIQLPLDSVRLNDLSYDPDGNLALRRWDKIGGTATYYDISNNLVADPLLYHLRKGTYIFKLTLRDSLNLYAYDTITITVQAPDSNMAPIPLGGPDVIIDLPVDSVRMADHSYDADQGLHTRRWDQISGPSTATISNIYVWNAKISNLQAGIYYFKLTLRDSLNKYSYDTIKITVRPEYNEAPTVVNGPDITIKLPLDSVRLNDQSYDLNGNLALRKWDKIGGTATYYDISNNLVADPLLYHLRKGTYIFKLTLRDSLNLYAYDTVTITVQAPDSNMAPIPLGGPDVTIELPVDSVRMADHSYDADQGLHTRRWDQISGPSTATISNIYLWNAKISNLQAGIYYFKLTLRDSLNKYSYDTIKITVLPSGMAAVLSEDPTALQLTGSRNPSFTSHPNPASTILNIRLSDNEKGQLAIKIYDMNGVLQRHESAHKTATVFQKSINISRLSTGIYYLHVTINGKSQAMRFMKK